MQRVSIPLSVSGYDICMPFGNYAQYNIPIYPTYLRDYTYMRMRIEISILVWCVILYRNATRVAALYEDIVPTDVLTV